MVESNQEQTMFDLEPGEVEMAPVELEEEAAVRSDEKTETTAAASPRNRKRKYIIIAVVVTLVVVAGLVVGLVVGLKDDDDEVFVSTRQCFEDTDTLLNQSKPLQNTLIEASDEFITCKEFGDDDTECFLDEPQYAVDEYVAVCEAEGGRPFYTKNTTLYCLDDDGDVVIIQVVNSVDCMAKTCDINHQDFKGAYLDHNIDLLEEVGLYCKDEGGPGLYNGSCALVMNSTVLPSMEQWLLDSRKMPSGSC